MGTTAPGAMSLIKSDVSMLKLTGELLPMVINDVDCQYSGLNAFWIIWIYVVLKPLVPGFRRALEYVPSTLSVGSTSCCWSGMAVSSLRPIFGKIRPSHDISNGLPGGPTDCEARLESGIETWTG